MSRSKESLHVFCQRRDCLRRRRLRVEHFDGIRSSVALQQSERNNDRLTRDFRLPKSRYAFLKDADYRKSKLSHSNLHPNGIDCGKNHLRQILCQETHLASRLHVVVIEIAPLTDEEIPDRLEILCDRDQRYRPFHTSGDNAHLHVVCTRDAHHSGNCVMDGFEVR